MIAPGSQTWREDLAWIALALVVALGAAILNGGPLFYYDTAGYLVHGDKMLELLGLPAPDTGGDGTVARAVAAPDDGTVVGSRSPVYALLLAGLVRLAGLWSPVVVQSALIVLTIHLVAAALARQVGWTGSAARLTALATCAAALGSLTFYTAYLMPDIFAPILLVAIAALAAWSHRLGRLQILAFAVLALGAVVTHPSHLAIALAMVPVAFLVPLAFRLPGAWRSGLLVLLVAAGGLAERAAFTVAVEKVTNNVVVYQPFFTARLIADGPGKDYLDANCPSAGRAICALNAMLVRPEQLAPSHILFSREEDTGSFALLPPDQKREISQQQGAFLAAVLLSRPGSVIWMALRNTLRQLGLVSIDMTIADRQTFDSASVIYRGFPAELANGLDRDRGWIGPLTFAQNIYYAAAGLVLIGFLVLPQSRLTRPVRAFIALLLLGLLANAFVCGAISEPANRYGARVIFLIPLVAAMLLAARPWTRNARPGI